LHILYDIQFYTAIPRLGSVLNNEEAYAEYQARYKESIEDPTTFWSAESAKYLEWFVPFRSVGAGGFQDGDVNWFAGGKLNAW
jgi:hypothetical protein